MSHIYAFSFKNATFFDNEYKTWILVHSLWYINHSISIIWYIDHLNNIIKKSFAVRKKLPLMVQWDILNDFKTQNFSFEKKNLSAIVDLKIVCTQVKKSIFQKIVFESYQASKMLQKKSVWQIPSKNLDWVLHVLFRKLRNFTISRNKVQVQPLEKCKINSRITTSFRFTFDFHILY